MVLGERFDGRAEVVAWADSVECLEFGAFSTGRSTEWDGRLSSNNSSLGPFQPRKVGATWPSTLQLSIVVFDHFEHTIYRISCFTGAGGRWLRPLCRTNSEISLVVGVCLCDVHFSWLVPAQSCPVESEIRELVKRYTEEC